MASSSNLSASYSSTSLQPPAKRFRKVSRNRIASGHRDDVDPNLTLDTNLGNMDGIVDTARVSAMQTPHDTPVPSPWDPPPLPPSTYGSPPSAHSTTLPAFNRNYGTNNNPFTNVEPFRQIHARNGKGRIPPPLHLSVSPKTTAPLNPSHYHHVPVPVHAPVPEKGGAGSPTWVAPPSWATIPKEGGNSSDEEDFGREIKRLDRETLPPSPAYANVPNDQESLYASGSIRDPRPSFSSPRTVREKSLPFLPLSAGVESITSRQREKAIQVSVCFLSCTVD